MKGFPDLPPVWAAGFAVAAIMMARVLPIVAIPRIAALVWLLVALGFGLILWSSVFFFRAKTPIEPHHVPTALIKDGPYRLSRNPIYLGMFLGLLGVALWSGGVSALIVVAFFPLVITARFILAEEAALREAFGEEANAFMRETGRWLKGF